MTERWAVYELIHAGEVVYVGFSVNPSARAIAHRSRGVIPKPFEVRVVQWHDDCGEAFRAERARIRKINPRCNVIERTNYPGAKSGPLRQWDKAEAERLLREGMACNKVAGAVGVTTNTIMRNFPEEVRAQFFSERMAARLTPEDIELLSTTAERG